MPKRKHKPEEIVAKLRQADVLISQGQDIADVIRQIGQRHIRLGNGSVGLAICDL